MQKNFVKTKPFISKEIDKILADQKAFAQKMQQEEKQQKPKK